MSNRASFSSEVLATSRLMMNLVLMLLPFLPSHGSRSSDSCMLVGVTYRLQQISESSRLGCRRAGLTVWPTLSSDQHCTQTWLSLFSANCLSRRHDQSYPRLAVVPRHRSSVVARLLWVSQYPVSTRALHPALRQGRLDFIAIGDTQITSRGVTRECLSRMAIGLLEQ